MNTMRNVLIASAIGCLFVFGPVADSVAEHEYEQKSRHFTVRCDEGKNPQRILDRIRYPGPIELHLVGTCPSLSIGRAEVWVLPGDDQPCPSATIEGEIEIGKVHGVELICLNVAGPNAYIGVYGGEVILERVNVYGSNDTAIEIRDGGSVYAEGISVTDNGEGIALEAGYAQFADSEIADNFSGVRVENNSYFEMGGGFIRNNHTEGVVVRSSSVIDFEFTEVSGNGADGVVLTGGS